MFYDFEADDQLALVSSEGERLTYRELDEAIRGSIGSVSLERHLCICLCENSPASVIGYLGALRAGLVPLMLDKRIAPALLAHLMDVYQPRYLYVPEVMAGSFEGFSTCTQVMGYHLLEKADAPAIDLNHDLALLLTTSGSTGSPKLVRQSARNIQSNTEAIVSYLGITESERAITTLPMNYTYGLSIINSHIQAHATILLTDSPMNMKRFWDFAREEGATSFGGVPFTYQMLKKVGFLKMDVPSLRYITQAGGKLSVELHQEFAEWAQATGKRFIVMYGQTEATARMGYLPAEMSLAKAGSMGIAIPGGSFTLLDAQDQPISEPGVVGELVYEGDNVTLGYAQAREDLALGDERGGVLSTGDMARFDEDGYYYIVGRKKRFLKIFGNRVNLDEIDRLLRTNFDGLDCASTGVDDRMVTYITREDLVGDVRRWLSKTTHLSQKAFDVRYLPAIPMNEAGKVLYKELPL